MNEQYRGTEEATDGVMTLAQEAELAVDKQSDQTADALQSFADTIQEKAGTMPGGDQTTEAGTVAAEKLERAADYVYERNPRQMAGQMQSVLKDRPAVAVAAGAIIGFIVGRMVK